MIATTVMAGAMRTAPQLRIDTIKNAVPTYDMTTMAFDLKKSRGRSRGLSGGRL
jgi:hypothetical protein